MMSTVGLESKPCRRPPGGAAGGDGPGWAA
jgi:hypothetical protein